MNTIKYLRHKTICPECNHKLYKNNKNEIYCIKCGLLVLDNYPITSKGIDNALRLSRLQKKKQVIKDLQYIGTFNGKRRYL